MLWCNLLGGRRGFRQLHSDRGGEGHWILSRYVTGLHYASIQQSKLFDTQTFEVTDHRCDTLFPSVIPNDDATKHSGMPFGCSEFRVYMMQWRWHGCPEKLRLIFRDCFPLLLAHVCVSDLCNLQRFPPPHSPWSGPTRHTHRWHL